MRRVFAGALAAAAAAVPAAVPPSAGADAAPAVWPLPGRLACNGALTSPLLDAAVGVDMRSGSAVARAARERYEPLLAAAGGGARGAVRRVVVDVAADDDTLSAETNYSYALSFAEGSANVSVAAASPYGVAYALETLLQLAERRCAAFDVADAPEHAYRGLMIDTGRRWYPVPLVRSTLDAMAAVKMNVLHFHLSEECFRVESKLYPSLHRRNCTFGGLSNNAYYTQEEVRSLVQYARLRGIRVVPEFDMPGHSGGLCDGLESAGMECCGVRTGNQKGQIYDDPAGHSVALVKRVVGEMAALFPDVVFNIGSDETATAGNCTLNNTRAFEEKVIAHLSSLGKTPMGWEEVLCNTGAAHADPAMIVEYWARCPWAKIAGMGFRTIEANWGKFYLDSPRHYASGMWFDINRGNTNATQRALLLGGETAMWQDNYVPKRYASCMFQSPQRDADFANSTSSTIWPRAAIAAGSFWRYDASLSSAAASAPFAALLRDVTRRLAARGVAVCPCGNATHTGCSQNDYCGARWC